MAVHTTNVVWAAGCGCKNKLKIQHSYQEPAFKNT